MTDAVPPLSFSSLVRRAADCIDAGDDVGADILLDLHLSRVPNDALALALQAQVLARRGDGSAAMSLARRSVALAPGHPLTLVAGARSALASGQGALAEKLARAAMNAHPGFGGAVEVLADLFRRDRRDHDLERLLDQALAAAPGHPLYLYWRATFYRMTDRLEAAALDVIEGLARAPDHPALWQAWAHLLMTVSETRALDAVRRARRLGLDDVGVWNLEGVILNRLRQPVAAEAALRTAMARDPLAPMPWTNLGNLLSRGRTTTDDLEAATDAYRQSLIREPDGFEALNNLAQVQRDRGETADAETLSRRASALRPSSTAALNTLANILRVRGKIGEGLALLRRALIQAPACPDTLSNLGLFHLSEEDRFLAERRFRHAARAAPTRSEIVCNLASFLVKERESAEAVLLARGLIVPDPVDRGPWLILAHEAFQRGDFETSARYYERIIRLLPTDRSATLSLAVTRWYQFRMTEALSSAERLLELVPDDHAALNLIANIVTHVLGHEASTDCYRRMFDEASNRYPNSGFLSNYAFGSHYDIRLDKAEIFRIHRKWDSLYGEGASRLGTVHLNSRDPDRPLRIGYVSPDFRRHSVAFFIMPILAGHDRSRFHVTCYGMVSNPDFITREVETLADTWRDLTPHSPKSAAALILEDKIDILVDLAGHTGDNALLLFARKPAPVQVSYLGYPNTTGLEAMDYRLTDAYADPPGLDEDPVTETLWRLPDSFLLFARPPEVPPVTPPPFLKNGYITFGTFNNTSKINRECVQVWQRILDATPGSRLFLKSKSFSDPGTAAVALSRLKEFGLDIDRVDTHQFVNSLYGHVECYANVDIALDTFPYNGTTTTFEALTMSVPVVSVRGTRHSGRVGASILINLGLADRLLGDSPDDMVAKAVALANDLEALTVLRATLRDTLRTSPLQDARRFIGNLEEAYRAMWRRWCAGPPTHTREPLREHAVMDDLEMSITPHV
ncbi:tetratricopeptide repeat protein [Pararhodospirillum oryzae]|uniref:protein O-GlcNAc transferase n=1 Tax=Pararhodospirillum oryzae TaxID=478448 RepID=A0A512H6B0_9PROT|nr:tetratricopeptide repeat protein [Pararhodospirillum oryzae]GEO81005.1 hypothetical protein ROR02_11360 [Pararhodospirillum oryzae]